MAYTDAQYRALLVDVTRLLLLRHYPISRPARITDHSDIVSKRKTDPGPVLQLARFSTTPVTTQVDDM